MLTHKCGHILIVLKYGLNLLYLTLKLLNRTIYYLLLQILINFPLTLLFEIEAQSLLRKQHYTQSYNTRLHLVKLILLVLNHLQYTDL